MFSELYAENRAAAARLLDRFVGTARLVAQHENDKVSQDFVALAHERARVSRGGDSLHRHFQPTPWSDERPGRQRPEPVGGVFLDADKLT
jgi:hypothetical protein